MPPRRVFGYRGARLDRVLEENRLRTQERRQEASERRYQGTARPTNIRDIAAGFGYGGAPAAVRGVAPLPVRPTSPSTTPTPLPVSGPVPNVAPTRAPVAVRPTPMPSLSEQLNVAARDPAVVGPASRYITSEQLAQSLSELGNTLGRAPSGPELEQFVKERAEFSLRTEIAPYLEPGIVRPEQIPGHDIPIIGRPASEVASSLTAPVSIMTLPAVPLRLTAAGIAGSVALGAAGEAAEEAGVPEVETPVGAIGPRYAGEVVGGFTTPGMLTAPGRAGVRAVGRQLPRSVDLEAARVAAGTGPFPVRAPTAATGARPAAFGRPQERAYFPGAAEPTPEGMRLTSRNFPSGSEIRNADIEHLETRSNIGRLQTKSGAPTAAYQRWLNRQAEIAAQADIDEVLRSGRSVDDQFADIQAELTEIEEGLMRRREFAESMRGGTLKSGTAPEFGKDFDIWIKRRPTKGRFVTGLAQDRRPTHRDLSDLELQAREKVYRDFVDNVAYLPEEGAAQVRFTPEGETVAEPTLMGEPRATQAELGIGAGERPVETAGPLFRQGEATAPAVEPSLRASPEGVPAPAAKPKPPQLERDIPDPVARTLNPEEPPAAPPPPEGPPPSIGQGAGGEPPQTPGGLLARFQDRLPGREMGRSDWAKYTGGLAAEGKEIELAARDLSRKAPNARYLKRTRTAENEAILKALHGEGEVPADAQAFFDELQGFRGTHEQRTLADVPSFEKQLLPQYWPRAWRNAREKLDEFRLGQRLERGEVSPKDFVTEHRALIRTGKLGPGAKPGTLRTRRLPLTFSEAIEQGWEPLSWNPVDLITLHAAELADYRYSSVLGELFKAEGRAIPASAAPTSWQRTPYPAFEPKAFVTPKGEARMSEALVVSPEDAKYLEQMLGKRPPAELADVGAYATSVFKRIKVFGGLFQHVDYTIRLANRSITRGEARFLPAGVKAMAANFVPQLRPRLIKSLLADPEIKEGVEEGLQLVGGLDVFKREMRAALEPDLVVRAPILGDIPTQRLPAAVRGRVKAVQDGINGVYGYVGKGLFDGAAPQYMGAFYKSVRKELAKAHPELTSRQLSALAAEHTNKLMSNIPDWQSVLGPRWRQAARASVFSINETEAWFRQVGGAFLKGKGPGARGLYLRQWAGYMAGTLALAELMNYAITGELLTEDQLAPIRWRYTDENGISRTSLVPRKDGRPEYNTTFARPRLDGDGPLGKLIGIEGPPIINEEGKETGDRRHIYVDLLGQADTPFRVFSPNFFAMSRLSPQLSQAVQQLQGKTFFGERPLEGEKERAEFAAKELLTPIPAAGFGEERERIGTTAAGIQAVGVNISAERLSNVRERVRDEISQEMFDKPYAELQNKAQEAKVNKHPRVTGLKEEGQRISLKSGGEAEERAVKRQQEETLLDELTTQGSVGGEKILRSTPQEFDALFLAGEIDADQWRDFEREFQMALRLNKTAIRAALGTQFKDETKQSAVDEAIDAYFEVSPLDYLDAKKQFQWDEYFSSKDAAYRSAVNLGGPDVEDYLRPLEERDVKRQYREAQDVLDAIPSKYKGLTPDQAETIDDFVYTEVPGERLRLIRRGETVKERDVARMLATKKNEVGLYDWYDYLKSERKRESILNPQYDTWRLQHMEELERWFPWLYDDIGFYQRTGLIEEEGRGLQPIQPIKPLEPISVR